MSSFVHKDFEAAESSSRNIDAVLASAHDAAPILAAMSPGARADGLRAVAGELENHREELVSLAAEETGLMLPRLNGELTRTIVQLRLFAQTIVDGAYLDVRIDPADPDFVLGPRPDLRRTHIPLGPVINFSASNFPFAFSVMGGDSAAILAAGCPLIVKAHSGHPHLSDTVARIAQQALSNAGFPEGTLQLVHGREEGVAILKDPRVRAGSFTGSIAVGRLLADIAAQRPDPIPFFGELGSVNPVFITGNALSERSESLAQELLASIAGSAGQLCTKPGFIFLQGSKHQFGEFTEQIRSAAPAFSDEHRLLDPRIASSFEARRTEIMSTPGCRTIVEGSFRRDASAQGWVTPTVVAFSLDSFRRGYHEEAGVGGLSSSAARSGIKGSGGALAEEAFGPLTILIHVPEGENLASLVSEFFEGNLTGTVHLSAEEARKRDEGVAKLFTALSTQVGRVLCNGWPTGVSVTPAQNHGGPWPATTNDSSTSVGTAAISRFLRPVAFQDVPDAYLHPSVQSSNPFAVPHAVSAPGESTNW